MSEPTPWMLFALIVMLMVICFLLGRRLDILSRRLDIVHRRITLNNKINGLQGGDWDAAGVVGESPAPETRDR